MTGNNQDTLPDIDRTAIFATILRRQALRRETRLPLLNVNAEYRKAVKQALWSAHVDQHYLRVRAAVLAERRTKFGQDWGLSVGGRWIVETLTQRALEASFSTR